MKLQIHKNSEEKGLKQSCVVLWKLFPPYAAFIHITFMCSLTAFPQWCKSKILVQGNKTKKNVSLGSLTYRNGEKTLEIFFTAGLLIQSQSNL